jgi:uncharacterized protein
VEKPVDVDKIFKRCLKSKGEGIITAGAVYLYCISPFMVHCVKFGPEDKKDPLSLYQKFLQELGNEHETNVKETQYPEAAVIKYATPVEGFKLMLEGMKRGVKTILSMPVFYLPEGLRGVIDVLERRDTAPSIFGDYHYVVKEIKYAKNLRNYHIYQTAFYNYLLGKIQGYTPQDIYLIDGDMDEIEEFYDEDTIKYIINDIREIFKGKKVTPTFGKCIWPWETYNNEEAIRRDDVSVICGVGPSVKRKLNENRIFTAKLLSETPPEDLMKIKGIGKKTAYRFWRKANAITMGKHIPIEKCEFTDKRTEIFLDLEGTGEHPGGEELESIDYLIGVVVRKNGKSKYIPFIARRPEEERKMFKIFIKWIEKQKDYVIFHWHHYESHHLFELASRYGLSLKMYQKLSLSLRDLYNDATNCFAFPTYTNGLKDVARYMGYRWKHADVDALESIALYFQYLKHPRKNNYMLKKVLEYNEDDCRATMIVKDWLQKNSSGQKD